VPGAFGSGRQNKAERQQSRQIRKTTQPKGMGRFNRKPKKSN